MTLEINNYSNALRIFSAAIEREFDLLLVHGRGGTGKTELITRLLAEKKIQHHYIRGYTTKIDFIREIYDHRDTLLVIDDVDNILRDRALVGILKQLCETTKVKHIHYGSPTHLLDDIRTNGPYGGVDFDVKSQVIIILNDLGKVSPDVRAFLTRGMELYFNPTNKEVLNYLKSWAKKGAPLTFMEEIAWQISDFNVRLYKLACSLYESKSTNGIWKELMIANLDIDQERLLALEITKKGGRYKDRVEKFVRMTGMSGRAYDRYLQDLEAEGLISRRSWGRGRTTRLS